MDQLHHRNQDRTALVPLRVMQTLLLHYCDDKQGYLFFHSHHHSASCRRLDTIRSQCHQTRRYPAVPRLLACRNKIKYNSSKDLSGILPIFVARL